MSKFLYRITIAVLYFIAFVVASRFAYHNLNTRALTPKIQWHLGGAADVQDKEIQRETIPVQELKTSETRPPSRPKQRAERKFVYLMNTEQCLPDHLASSEAIGNATACDCEVMVLSYKRPCNDKSLRHVKYFYGPSTGVGGGRNVLYEAAMARDHQQFLYYIIIDDDVQLEAKDKLKIPNPWRTFERSLLRYEPAIAALTWTDVESCYWCLKNQYSYRKKLGCELSSNDHSSDFIPVVHFDAAFSAFHRRAAACILPYVTTFENVSAIFHQTIVVMKAEIMFRGSVVAHTSVTALNTKHRAQVRVKKIKPSPSQLLTLLEVVEKSLPEDYKHSSVAQEWREQGKEHIRRSSTLCLGLLEPT